MEIPDSRLCYRSALVNDFQVNRKYGDPVVHYTARASTFQVNGKSILTPKDRQPIYVIFDTGVTGMVVSQELLDQRYVTARENREKSLWGKVDVGFRTQKGETMWVTARKPVTTPLGNKPWPKYNKAHLIVLGLSFFRDIKLE